MSLSLRKADLNDCDLLFNWSNEESVRMNSIRQETIVYENHVSWFKGKLSSVETDIYILQNGGVPVGQIRFDKNDYGYLLDYSIAANERGKGYGALIISITLGMLPASSYVFAYVKEKNLASIRCLEKCGFKSEGEEYVQEVNLLKFKYLTK
jgi:RimJ/RimL family protein N-acetyltransferase